MVARQASGAIIEFPPHRARAGPRGPCVHRQGASLGSSQDPEGDPVRGRCHRAVGRPRTRGAAVASLPGGNAALHGELRQRGSPWSPRAPCAGEAGSTARVRVRDRARDDGAGARSLQGGSWDNAHDSLTYHGPAAMALADGVNPLRGSLGHFLADHYPKAAWIFSGGMYRLTGNIEYGKSITVLLALACFGVAGTVFLSVPRLRAGYAYLLAALVTLNPVTVVQLDTHYVDGLFSSLGRRCSSSQRSPWARQGSTWALPVGRCSRSWWDRRSCWPISSSRAWCLWWRSWRCRPCGRWSIAEDSRPRRSSRS